MQSPGSHCGTRERLLHAGQAIAAHGGMRALTVRAVTSRAKANLGSFVYHFGSRDAFVDELIERWYAPLFAQLQPLAQSPGDPLEHLREVMLQLVLWLANHRHFVAQLLVDAASGEAGPARFLRSLDRRHPALVLQLIAQAQAAGRLRRDDPAHQMMFLMSTMAAPVLLFHLLGQRELAPPALARTLTRFSVDPTSVRQRLDWALRGLSVRAAADLAGDPPATDPAGDAVAEG